MQLRALAVAAGLFWPVSADTQAVVSYLETGNMLYADCSTSMGRTACTTASALSCIVKPSLTTA